MRRNHLRLFFVFALFLGACAHPKENERRRTFAGETVYSYVPVATAEPGFQPVLLTESQTFEWRNLTLSIDSWALEKGNRLSLIFDVMVENRGSRPLRWDDYAVYTGLRDATGSWDYRLLFTNQAPPVLAPGGKARLRYHVHLPGMALPDGYGLVLQNVLGGRDVMFPFARVRSTLGQG